MDLVPPVRLLYHHSGAAWAAITLGGQETLAQPSTHSPFPLPWLHVLAVLWETWAQQDIPSRTLEVLQDP